MRIIQIERRYRNGMDCQRRTHKEWLPACCTVKLFIVLFQISLFASFSKINLLLPLISVLVARKGILFGAIRLPISKETFSYDTISWVLCRHSIFITSCESWEHHILQKSICKYEFFFLFLRRSSQWYLGKSYSHLMYYTCHPRHWDHFQNQSAVEKMKGDWKEISHFVGKTDI